MSKKLLWGLVGALVLAIVAIGGYKAWFFLYPPLAFTAPVDDSCDLHSRACETRLPGGGRVTFSIEPRPVRTMESLQLRVTPEDVDVYSVEVDFAGIDMNMGFNRFALQRKEDGRFTGNAVLPACIRSRMAWEAKVLMRTDEGIVAIPYRFDTVR